MKKTLTLIFFINIYLGVSQTNLVDTSIVARFDSTYNFYLIKASKHILANNIINIGSLNSLKISNLNSFTVQKVDTDEIGSIHYRYKQFYNGVLVDYSQLKIHCNTANEVVSINGNFSNISSFNVVPSFTSYDAINYSKTFFPSAAFAWEDTLAERTIKTANEDFSATNYPTPILVIVKSPLGYKLSYKLIISTVMPIESWIVYIDALTGALLKKENQIKACFNKNHLKENKLLSNSKLTEINYLPADISSCDGTFTGTGNTLYYGSQYILTEKFKSDLVNCKYRLKDTYTGTYLYTRDYNSGDIKEITDETNNWTYALSQPGVTAHWCLEMVHDYYRYSHNRNSYDDSFSQMNLFINNNSSRGGTENAFWSSANNSMNIGTGGGSLTYNDLTSLDIIGHEITHGVNDYSANLTYEAEYGALDESFADIFGTMVEFYAKSTHSAGGSGNYLCGEDMWRTGAVRNLANPKQFNQPDTYNGIFWISTIDISEDNDYGGVHTNSGVQNFWFYLLAEGSNATDGINDNGNSYCVKGIGRDKAAKIAFHNLTKHLVANSKYDDARFFSIQSAIELFGANSNEVAQVTAAWYAVGVGPQYNGPIDIKNITFSSPATYQYNTSISLQNIITNPTAGLVVTSNTEIELLNEISFNPGSENELYITPACLGGARIGNTNVAQNSNSDSTIFKTKASNSDLDLIIIPNPTTGNFVVKTNTNLEYPTQIIIRNVLGQLIQEINKPNTFETEINITKENAGIYFVNIFYTEKVISKKIIKE